ncbi:MAG: J domain-containing protein [Rhizobiaceae bacterium]
MTIKTYYDDLQVARSATPEVIAAAYRSLSLKHHPDRNMGDTRREHIIQAINEAYAVLSDPVKRKGHDDWIAAQEARAAARARRKKRRRAAGSHVGWAYFTRSAGNRPRPLEAATRDMMSKYPMPESMRRFGVLYLMAALALIFWIGRLLDTETTHDYAAAQGQGWGLREEYSAPKEPNPLLEEMKAAKERQGSLGNISESEPEDSGPWEKSQEDHEDAPLSDYEPPAALATAPNGASWPDRAGYVPGYERLNMQGRSSVTIDNSRNSSDAFVKLVDLSGTRPRAVRSVFVPARKSYTIHSVAPGLYDIRYKDIEDGGASRSESFTLAEVEDGHSIRYDTMTITLYKVSHGNMETYPISEEEFEAS